MALMAKQELLLLISGGLFVLETVSVILQVFAFKRFKRRIFKMAPIHHHFELLGWPEAKITVRFGIISLVLCLLALITLKLRSILFFLFLKLDSHYLPHYRSQPTA